jgi:hypothetical protein
MRPESHKIFGALFKNNATKLRIKKISTTVNIYMERTNKSQQNYKLKNRQISQNPEKRRDFLLVNCLKANRGSTVVKVLCYKSEGRWFDHSWCQWIFD